jgi:hypothetical protein
VRHSATFAAFGQNSALRRQPRHNAPRETRSARTLKSV